MLVIAVLPGLIGAQGVSSKNAGASGTKSSQESEGGRNHKQRLFRAAATILGKATEAEDLRKAQKILLEGYPGSRPHLLEILKGSSGRARAFAVKVIGEAGNPRDVELVGGALADSLPSVRMAAVVALGDLGREGYPFLERHLPGETEPNVRKLAVRTLEKWGHPVALPLLVRLLGIEEDAVVRGLIVSALETLSGRKLGDDARAWESFLEDHQTGRERQQLFRMVESRERQRDEKAREKK